MFVANLTYFHFSVSLSYLHSFPTRRSSDLVESIRIVFLYLAVLMLLATGNLLWYFLRGSLHGGWINYALLLNGSVFLLYMGFYRSEEHTSELQSRFDLVCRLLLEKKKYE